MSDDELDPSADPAPPAAVWHSWLSTVRGRPRRKGHITHPPEPYAVAAEGIFGSAHGIDWQRLWLATQRRPWRSLAVIAAGKGISTPRVARVLAEVGSCHLGTAIAAHDATAITLARLGASVEAWIERRDGGRRVLIAVGPVLESPAGLALARAADAVLLCLTLRESSISEVARTIEEVGKERVIGSVVVSPEGR